MTVVCKNCQGAGRRFTTDARAIYRCPSCDGTGKATVVDEWRPSDALLSRTPEGSKP